MRLAYLGLAILSWPLTLATILQNGQVKDDPYPGQAPVITLDDSWRNYGPDVPEIAYKGRWDSKHISCMLMISFEKNVGCSDRRVGWSFVSQLFPPF